MTIRFTKSWNGYYEGQIVTNPAGGNTEAQLIALGYAVSDLDGPDNGLQFVKAETNPTTGAVSLVVGGVSLANPRRGGNFGGYLTTVFIGDSISANSGTLPSADTRSFFHMGNWLSGAPFEVIGNFGVAGWNTGPTQIQTEIASAIALSPTCVDMMAGINDIGTYTAAQTCANLQLMWGQLIGAGIYVRAYTILPYKGTAAQMGNVNYINTFIREYWRNTPNGECIDAFTAVVSPTAVDGSWIANTYQDGAPPYKHPSTYGALLIGQLVATSLQKWTKGMLLPSSATDDILIATGGLCVSKNPLMIGSGGSVANGATGATIPSSYTINGGGTTTAVTVPSRADGFGNNLSMAVSGTTSLGATVNVQPSSIHAALVAGNKYYAVCEITIAAGAVNVSHFGLALNSDVAGSFGSIGTTAQNLPLVIPAAGLTLTLRTPVQTYPGGATYVIPQPQIVFAAAGGSATFTVGRFAVYQRPL